MASPPAPRRKHVVAALAAALLWAGAARAQMPFSPFGARSAALGGASVGLGPDVAAGIDNPAAVPDRKFAFTVSAGLLTRESGDFLAPLRVISGNNPVALASGSEPRSYADVVRALRTLADPGNGFLGNGVAGLAIAHGGWELSFSDWGFSGLAARADLVHTALGIEPCDVDRAQHLGGRLSRPRAQGPRARQIDVVLPRPGHGWRFGPRAVRLDVYEGRVRFHDRCRRSVEPRPARAHGPGAIAQGLVLRPRRPRVARPGPRRRRLPRNQQALVPVRGRRPGGGSRPLRDLGPAGPHRRVREDPGHRPPRRRGLRPHGERDARRRPARRGNWAAASSGRSFSSPCAPALP